MADHASRIHRLLRIITLVQGDRSLTPARLANMLDIGERSLYRDLEALRAAGVPIDFDDEAGGYVIRKDFFLRPTELSLDEALALCLLAEQARDGEQLPHMQAAARAIEKIRSNLPATFREELEQSMPHVSIALARTENEGSADVFRIVRAAIASRRALTCCYQSPRRTDAAAPFRFDPYAIYFGQRAWYAIGKRHPDGEIRTLKLSRFERCSPTDQPIHIPDDFSLERYFGHAWRMMRSDTRHAIRLQFSPTVAETVADTWWHATQQVEWQDDDSVTITFEVDGLEEIVWWIMGYGPHCKVLDPPELRDRVKAMAAEMTRLYETEESSFSRPKF